MTSQSRVGRAEGENDVLRDLFDVLGDLFKKKKRPDTPTSEQQAVEIAQRAVAGQPFAHLLTMASIKEEAGKLTWIVGTAGVGSTMAVCVDATSGEVVKIERHAGR
jgi:uncharacterized membrane protein YkoI